VKAFVSEHGALLLKHARAHIRSSGEKTAPADVARELELMLQQLGAANQDLEASIVSPDAFVRSIVLPAARRAKRRQTLIEQIAAGDDLSTISDDLAALDADLPVVKSGVSSDATEASTVIDALKAKLAPRDALVFALLIEDDSDIDGVARILSMAMSDVEEARARILATAREAGIEGEDARRERST
jgi:hypothetical protein